jgi:hypothetical protein
MMKKLILVLSILSSAFALAQTSVNGKVVDQNGAPVANANIIVVGQSEGAVADFDGNFAFTTSLTPPFTCACFKFRVYLQQQLPSQDQP